MLNKRTIENLAAAGTFDVLNPNRAQVVASIDVIMGEATSHARDCSSGQGGLFGEEEAAPFATAQYASVDQRREAAARILCDWLLSLCASAG